MQIFAYTESPEFHALLEVEVKEITGVRPVVQSSFQELKGLLSIFQTIDLLIVDLPIEFPHRDELKIFLLNSKNRMKQVLVLGEEEDISSGHIKSFAREQVVDLFDEVKTNFAPSEAVDFSWTGVPLITLLHFESLPFDLYIKLSDNKYIKRIPAYEKVDLETIETFQSKNIQTLYCEKKYNRDFSMMLINNMINSIDKKYPSVSEEMKSNEQVFQTTRAIIQSLGLAGRVVEVCEATVDKMCQDVLKDANEFSEYLKNLQTDRTLAFQYRLIILTNYIGAQLIVDMGMFNGDEQLRKLVFASFFCDMYLTNPKFLYHRSPEEGEGLNMDEQNEVNFHALKASQLAGNYKDCSKEIVLIIQQHHGSFSGIGFPKEKSSQLLPLSKILIVAQELAFSILTNEETPAMDILKKFLRQNRCNGLQELLVVLEKHMDSEKEPV